jgi:hypothetical protein
LKGKLSQEEHQNIFSGLKIKKMNLSDYSDATVLFSTFCFLSVTLTVAKKKHDRLEKKIFF